jgi:hypothetical protein
MPQLVSGILPSPERRGVEQQTRLLATLGYSFPAKVEPC